MDVSMYRGFVRWARWIWNKGDWEQMCFDRMEGARKKEEEERKKINDFPPSDNEMWFLSQFQHLHSLYFHLQKPVPSVISFRFLIPSHKMAQELHAEQHNMRHRSNAGCQF